MAHLSNVETLSSEFAKLELPAEESVPALFRSNACFFDSVPEIPGTGYETENLTQLMEGLSVQPVGRTPNELLNSLEKIAEMCFRYPEYFASSRTFWIVDNQPIFFSYSVLPGNFDENGNSINSGALLCLSQPGNFALFAGVTISPYSERGIENLLQERPRVEILSCDYHSASPGTVPGDPNLDNFNFDLSENFARNWLYFDRRSDTIQTLSTYAEGICASLDYWLRSDESDCF